MNKSSQFVIPIYQRTYSWTEKECQQLWDDIIRTEENDAITAHFVGSIVYIEEGIYQITGHTPLLVIDGQQRLTTLSLLLAALAENLENYPESEQEPIDGFSPRKLRHYYLINREEEGERRYRLILSQTDRDSLIAVIEGRELPRDVSYRIEENYKFFKDKISEYEGDLTAICKGIAKQVRDLYNFRSRSYWLRKLENHDRKEFVKVNEYTIEHIIPQNENLSQEWKNALGDSWEEIHKTWLYTLGIEKRDMQGGFRESPLKLNRNLGLLDEWNEQAIKNRAKQLSEWAVRVWQTPDIDDEILDAYRPRKESKSGYSIEDHPYLASGSQTSGDTVSLLFQAFRREVLALDPVVTEEFLKLYVAYKAETNFVDVIPQAKRLLLSLNIPFTEVVDPLGICTDVSDRGRWGNGDVEVGLASFDELPYAIGLIRQAYERQMGNGMKHDFPPDASHDT